MTLEAALSSPVAIVAIGLLTTLALAIVGAAVSASAVVTRETRPGLSRWLAAFAAALPGDVARMRLDPLPPVAAPAKADPKPAPEDPPTPKD
jgi:hypothetical protein